MEFSYLLGGDGRMKLKMYARNTKTKSELTKVRQQGDIPAVIYATGRKNQNIAVHGADLQAILRSIGEGQLSTTRFTLVDGVHEIQALVKEIQYFPTSYDVRHLDFLQADVKQRVRVRVPIEYTGVADCQGIRLGGFLRQVIRHVLVECDFDSIPTSLPLDVKELFIGQSKRLSELCFPEGVRPLVNLREVAVVIAKR